MAYLRIFFKKDFLKTAPFSWLVFLPVTFRVLITQFSFGFDEYEVIFLYANDFFLMFFLLSAVPVIARSLPTGQAGLRRGNLTYFSELKIPLAALIVFLILAAISIFIAPLKILSAYYFARLLTAALASALLALALRGGYIKIRYIFGVFAGWGILESVIAFLQFCLQSSAGLKFLGEPYLPGFLQSAGDFLLKNPAGLANINIYGAKLVRAYGTFPHPNVLAAFLLLALFSFYYFWMITPAIGPKLTPEVRRGIKNRVLISVGISVVALGLVLTFSRSAWLIAIVMTALLTLWVFVKREKKKALTFAAVTVIAAGIWAANLNSLIFPRAQVTLSEPSVTYRLTYNEMALDLIKNNPLGVGLGNQVFYSVQNQVYQKFGMDKLWQWQPVHNIYLLMASEIGVLGLIAFLVFIGGLFSVIARSLPAGQAGLRRGNLIPVCHSHDDGNLDPRLRGKDTLCRLESVIPLIMLLALLAFGLVDHFLWTLEPGRLMLWVVIGIIMGTSKPSSFNG